jgi:23S rRNA (adenine2503-C2)-methyltransferase
MCSEEYPRGARGKWRGRHVLFEYVMLAGVNDAPEHARELIALVADIECKINLIAFNAYEGTQFAASAPDAMLDFRSILINEGGLVCTMRDSRGDDEMAACGQLGNPAMARQPRAMANYGVSGDMALAGATIH